MKPCWIVVILLIGVGVFLGFNFEKEVYYQTPPETVFIYGQEINEYGFDDYIKERVSKEKKNLIDTNRDFIYLDLQKMELSLYEQGIEIESLEIKSKGKGFWQTPPGTYFVGDKVANHFSSISGVWSPYAIQFYGNFFIHGWPYTTSGHPLPPGPSGGCLRLATPDSLIVYNFVERGMPVLVFDEVEKVDWPAIEITETLDVEADALLVADLNTGELLAVKNIDSEITAGPVNRLIFSLSSSEMVSMSRTLVARSWMLDNFNEGVIVPNHSYSAETLINLMLNSSSQEAISVLSRFFTDEAFLSAMRVKTRSLGMKNTDLVDITGVGDSVTTLRDIAKMMRYINDYRSFLFDIADDIQEDGLRIKIIRGDRTFLIASINAQDFEKITNWLTKQI